MLHDRHLSLDDALMLLVFFLIMNSPDVARILRPTNKRTVVAHGQRSFRLISQRYLRGEPYRVLVLGAVIFLILAAISLWPVINAAEFIRTYLL